MNMYLTLLVLVYEYRKKAFSVFTLLHIVLSYSLENFPQYMKTSKSDTKYRKEFALCV